jgi:hypothetical protein
MDRNVSLYKYIKITLSLVILPVYLICIFLYSSCAIDDLSDFDTFPTDSGNKFIVNIRTRPLLAIRDSRVIPIGSVTLRVSVKHEQFPEVSDSAEIDPESGTATLALSGVYPGINEATIQVLDDSDNILAQRKHCFFMPSSGNYVMSAPLDLGVAIKPNGTCEPANIEIPLGTELYYENWSETTTGSIKSTPMYRFIENDATGRPEFDTEPFIVDSIDVAQKLIQHNIPAFYDFQSYSFNVCGEYTYITDAGFAFPGKVTVNELKPDETNAENQRLAVLDVVTHSFNFGGEFNDRPRHMIKTSDNHLVIVGHTRTTSSAAPQSVYITKIDMQGTPVFTKTYQSDGTDRTSRGERVLELANGNYLIGSSTNGQVTGRVQPTPTKAPNYGDYDIWLMEINKNTGNTVWECNYGSSAEDRVYDMIEEDDGYVIVGMTRGNNNDVSGRHGASANNEIWIAKIDKTNQYTVLWQRCIGGAGGGGTSDIGFRIIRLGAGIYLIGGHSTVSDDGDIPENPSPGTNSLVLVKYDHNQTDANYANRRIRWVKVMGGTAEDSFYDMFKTPDGGVIICGNSASSVFGEGYDRWGNYGSTDAFAVKVYSVAGDTAPNIEYAKNYGGSGTDRAANIIEHPDGGYVLLGTTNSGTDDLEYISARGGYDYWIVRLQADLNVLWNTRLGGTGNDYTSWDASLPGGNIIHTGLGKYVISGYSPSGDGDIDSTKTLGDSDIWVCFATVFLDALPDPSKGAIKGSVRREGTTTAISGATVSILDGLVEVASTTTASNGKYTLSDLPPGTYTITASRTGYITHTGSVTVTAGQVTNHPIIYLTTAPGTITGSVMISGTSTGISGATVTAGTASTTTAANGTYTLNDVAAGTHTITVTKEGYSTHTGSVTVTAGQNTEHPTIYMTATPGSITGTVMITGTSTGISGATVTVDSASATTASNGTYTLSSVPPGTHTITVTRSGYETHTGTVTVTSGQNTSHPTIYMTALPGSITGTVRISGTSTGISGATVSIGVASTTTAGDGTYTLSDVPAGTYTITVTATNYQTHTGSVTVTAGQNTSHPTIYLTLTPGSITGTVMISGTSTAISGATVSIGVTSTTTASNGTYTLSSVPPGTYTITVTKSGYQTHTGSVSVSAGQNTSHPTIYLTPEASQAIVSGTAKTAGGTNVPNGTEITFYLSGGGSYITTTSGGTYTITVPPGTYDILSWCFVSGTFRMVSLTGQVFVSGNNTKNLVYE